MSEHLPPRYAEVERELDRIARRLLDEHLSGKADHTDLFGPRASKEMERDHERDRT